MYIVCHGSLEYVPISGDVKVVGEGECIAEATLWCPWMHRGLLKGSGEGRLCVLDAKKYQDIVAHFDHPHFDPRWYATAFVAYLNRADADEQDISDLTSGSGIEIEMDTIRANRSRCSG